MMVNVTILIAYKMFYSYYQAKYFFSSQKVIECQLNSCFIPHFYAQTALLRKVINSALCAVMVKKIWKNFSPTDPIFCQCFRKQ